MNKVSLIEVLSILILFCLGNFACGDSPNVQNQESLNESIVQVWQSGVPVANGITTGDGSRIFTVLIYDSFPDNITVSVRSDNHYQASIEAYDLRTGATLLKISDGVFPAVTITPNETIEPDQYVYIQGWNNTIAKRVGNDIRTTKGGDYVFRKTPATITTELNGTPPQFHIMFDFSPNMPPEDIRDVGPGEIVTNANGIVLGLTGNSYWGLIPPPTSPMVPPVIGINNFFDLVSLNTSSQFRTTGPTGFAVAKPNSLSAYTEVPADYEIRALSLIEVLEQDKEPLTDDELEELLLEYSKFPFNPKTGSIGYTLIARYAFPIKITGLPDMVEAKWIAVQFSGPYEKPLYLYYGNSLCLDYDAEGGFRLINK